MRLALAFAAALGLAGLSSALPVADVHAQDTASFNNKFKVAVSRRQYWGDWSTRSTRASRSDRV